MYCNVYQKSFSFGDKGKILFLSFQQGLLLNIFSFLILTENFGWNTSHVKKKHKDISSSRHNHENTFSDVRKVFHPIKNHECSLYLFYLLSPYSSLPQQWSCTRSKHPNGTCRYGVPVRTQKALAGTSEKKQGTNCI